MPARPVNARGVGQLAGCFDWLVTHRQGGMHMGRRLPGAVEVKRMGTGG